jgi:23S rRNA pseudouridine1911/1915/1917 synthase
MTAPVVLFEDNHCLAVAKPAGLLTQGVPAGVTTLESWAKDYMRSKYGKPGKVYLGVPHRLDRPVSGVVLFARNSKSAARLAEQFQKQQVEKTYWAIVSGALEQPIEPWVDWLHKISDEARVEPVEPETPGAKKAVLEVRRCAIAGSTTWVELRPHTGRTHQLRVQTAARGHPIVGDELYGSTVSFGPPASLPRDRIIALHARSLTFLHPIRYEPMTLMAPLPDYWPALPPDFTLDPP